MNIFIDNKSGAPIYEQIFTQLKSQIISGTLPSDEALPSIRSLAKDLRISVVTTKRAYDELEKEGFIYTIAAKGCFVAPLKFASRTCTFPFPKLLYFDSFFHRFITVYDFLDSIHKILSEQGILTSL